ncbi:hypothetical protein CC79DRAFT_1333226 [Sarocladium strictum]
MLTSVARAALRRVLTRAPAATTSTAARTLPIRPALQVRSFTSSQVAWEAQTPKSAGVKKSTVAKKTPAKKAAAKKKVAAKKPKKKVIAKKKKAPVKPKRKLTPEEKEANKIRDLKSLSLLSEPKGLPINPWMLYVAQNQRQKPSSETQKAAARGYHDLSATEMSELRASADANKAANHAQYLEWVESYTSEVIMLANLSRRELARKTGKKLKPIEDARLPNRVRSGFNFYIAESLTGRGKDSGRFGEIANAWKTMSPEEKRPFNEMSEAEKTLINRQREEVMANVKALKQTIKEEKAAAKPPSRSRASKTKATATDELGL